MSGVVAESTLAFVEQTWLPIILCSKCTYIITARLPMIVNTVLNAHSCKITQMCSCQAVLCANIKWCHRRVVSFDTYIARLLAMAGCM